MKQRSLPALLTLIIWIFSFSASGQINTFKGGICILNLTTASDNQNPLSNEYRRWWRFWSIGNISIQ